MKLKENDKIEINSVEFLIKEVRDINFTHDKNNRTYFTYLLSSKNKNITDASLDYISDNNIIFHLTKKVDSEIKENKVLIDSDSYEILNHEVGIFMDYGEHKDVHEYKLKSKKDELLELHILPNNTQILYLNKKITSNEVIIKK